MPDKATSQGQRLFDNKISPTALLVFYGLLAIVLMATDFKSDYVGKMRDTVSLLAAPFYAALQWPFMMGKNLLETARYRQSLLDEIEEYRRQQLRTQGQLQEMDAIRLEISRLRSLLGASSSLRVEFQFAELLRVDLDPFSHRVLINLGRSDGVFAGQPVIDGNGIVGQVESVLPGYSYVTLISDPSHALPIQVARTGQRSILYGTGDTELLILPNLPFNIDLQPGDTIITSGLGERFPNGFPVAELMSVERRAGQTFAVGYARPLAALDRGREVLLLKLEPANKEQAATVASQEAQP